MREGMNPNRDAPFTGRLPPALPVVCIITHYTDAPYHSERFEIIAACLKSAKKFAGYANHFMVWDNGSLPILREWIMETIAPDTFVQSKNIGKQNAMRIVCQMWHGAQIAFSDDDILFYPDWLAEQVTTAAIFGAGHVSGVTTRWHMRRAITSGFALNPQDVPAPPIEWDKQHLESIGTKASDAASVLSGARVLGVERYGTRAYLGGSHCQFLCHADELLPLLSPANRLMQPLAPLDEQLDDYGVYRLLTHNRTARHIGNRMSEADRREIYELIGV